jgi:hypothetical protein
MNLSTRLRHLLPVVKLLLLPLPLLLLLLLTMLLISFCVTASVDALQSNLPSYALPIRRLSTDIWQVCIWS